MTDMLKIALSQYGTKEYPNAENPRILAYAQDVGEKWVKTDETSWCSIFMSWVAQNAFMPMPEKPALARSWLGWGEPVGITDAIVGDVCIFWRGDPDGWQGHVGLFIAHRGEVIHVLGGNQGNRVQISPYQDYGLLGVRRMRHVEGEIGS